MVLELVQERCMNLLVEAVAQTKALFVLLRSNEHHPKLRELL